MTFLLIYKLWESQLQYLNFFQKIKCKIFLEANIDDVALTTLNINIPIFYAYSPQFYVSFLS